MKDSSSKNEDPRAASKYSYIFLCRLCEKIGNLAKNWGSTATATTHLTAFHNKQYLDFQKKVSSTTDIAIFFCAGNDHKIKTVESLYKEILRWICHSGLPFTVIEDPYLVNILRSLQCFLSGRIRPTQFPRANYFRNRLDSLHSALEAKKLRRIRDHDSRVAITTDMWTSKTQTSFVATTMHWIDKSFKLKNILLTFLPLDGSHNSDMILAFFLETVHNYKLNDKISYITLDNASANLKFLKNLAISKSIPDSYSKPLENNHARCLAHVFHLDAQAFTINI